MKNFFQISLIALFVLAAFTQVDAQKYGYTNSAVILAQMPDVKQADAKLEARQKQMENQLQKKYENLIAKKQDLEKQYNEGGLSPKQAEVEVKKLQEEEAEIMKSQNNMSQELAQKREELVKPILKKVQDAIDAVAKEKGYTYIFDASTGMILYAKPEDDITDAVKSKLGI